MLLHKPWIKIASPSEATGNRAQKLPEGDMAWKFVKIKGVHLVICFVYFDANVGLSHENMNKFQRCIACKERTGAKLIIAGDFNMTPQDFTKSGIFNVHDMRIIDTGGTGTCKHSTGRSNIDYIIADNDLAALVDQVEIVADVPWQPHTGI